MLKVRVIPVLLLKGQGLVKTIHFKDPQYVGDPINAVRIFNDKEVDELIFLDTMATVEKRRPNFKVVTEIAGECFMPFGYGGGIRDLEDLKVLFSLGAEKAVINSHAIEHPEFIRSAADRFGSQSVIVSMDVKRDRSGAYRIYTHGGRMETGLDPLDTAVKMQAMGAGEIILTSIEREGTGKGYDLELIKGVAGVVNIPVVANGGAGKIEDFVDAVRNGAAAVAAGSMFVFQGKHRAVLISYPNVRDLDVLNK